ncbi:hypothetical protein Poli38472_004314 [Pythium oligandrum]|uniref:Activating signal cointegrator 1 N-terminal domain-containing protein n=1 Tax=Pythium oligandrum TaxID=41045 RepID=A0A8K1CN48_PYTOL|nr:hypothetical protein Poli38472_004314 [Pythium oligandrum]|eukprot:TMW66549.1 hypothetical protein Poli38472_004314 [Pythium oligandrum]
MGKKQQNKQQQQEQKPVPEKKGQAQQQQQKQAAPAPAKEAPVQQEKKGGKKGGKKYATKLSGQTDETITHESIPHMNDGGLSVTVEDTSPSMDVDAAIKSWLKQELVSVLGFPEVDDILSYILSSFHTKDEVEQYLTELLGIPQSRAKTISLRLFASSKDASTEAIQKRSARAQDSSKQATPLVPKPAEPNSRIKQAKIKKPSKVLHSRIINCLKCGKIEYNAARRCAFCDSELRYEELDEDLMDPAAQEHMKRLVEYDESSAERTKVIDTEEHYYDELSGGQESESRSRQPIVLNLDLENRAFTASGVTPAVLSQNQDLAKDARDLLQRIQTKLEKEARSNRRGVSSSVATAHSPEHPDAGIVVEDEYNTLYV